MFLLSSSRGWDPECNIQHFMLIYSLEEGKEQCSNITLPKVKGYFLFLNKY